jgi:hypothetical protein
MSSKAADLNEAGINWASREVAERRSHGQAGRDEKEKVSGTFPARL